jgi:hypothetical protein
MAYPQFTKKKINAFIIDKRNVKKEDLNFEKYSLAKGKKYKNTFKKFKGKDIISDEEGKHYLVDKHGTIFTKDGKWFDEVWVD